MPRRVTWKPVGPSARRGANVTIRSRYKRAPRARIVRGVRTSRAALLSMVCALASGCAQTPPATPPAPPEPPPDPKPDQTQAPSGALPQVLREVVAGYAAKVMASAIFVSHRTLDSVLQ